MSLEKSDGVILRVVEFSNTSCVVTALTRDFGKISALAKGAWRRKSPFEAALDVMAICHLVFVHKTGDVLHLLTEAKLERRFRAAARELTRFYAGYYLIELVLLLTEESDPQPELYDLLVNSLQALDDGEAWEAWVLHFELRSLAILGHAPALENCTVCGESIRAAQARWFGLASGGLVCGRCRPGKRSIVAANIVTVETLREFAKPARSWRGKAAEEATAAAGPVRGLMNQFMTYLLSRRPKLFDFLFAKVSSG